MLLETSLEKEEKNSIIIKILFIDSRIVINFENIQKYYSFCKYFLFTLIFNNFFAMIIVSHRIHSFPAYFTSFFGESKFSAINP